MPDQASSPGPQGGMPTDLTPPRQVIQAMPQPADGQEVIIIIRDRGNPQVAPRVMTLARPSGELMQLLEGQMTMR